jgi:hypothetical protein
VFHVGNICGPVTDHLFLSREADGSCRKNTFVFWMSGELNSRLFAISLAKKLHRSCEITVVENPRNWYKRAFSRFHLYPGTSIMNRAIPCLLRDATLFYLPHAV